ncbi:hypothetical protein NA57DRAFT_60142 [Rhizodiscina lignyota]|uniref:Uncharacterized protein n=1 Tax=Rhizodiscina lignyota TaxID=1504668 RepID=A0A9P4I6D9_9PEZI|nr:hypothetical protein NA57DRAFT_60142 [Rhizodiscina lignyota]
MSLLSICSIDEIMKPSNTPTEFAGPSKSTLGGYDLVLERKAAFGRRNATPSAPPLHLKLEQLLIQKSYASLSRCTPRGKGRIQPSCDPSPTHALHSARDCDEPHHEVLASKMQPQFGSGSNVQMAKHEKRSVPEGAELLPPGPHGKSGRFHSLGILATVPQKDFPHLFSASPRIHFRNWTWDFIPSYFNPAFPIASWSQKQRISGLIHLLVWSTLLPLHEEAKFYSLAPGRSPCGRHTGSMLSAFNKKIF